MPITTDNDQAGVTSRGWRGVEGNDQRHKKNEQGMFLYHYEVHVFFLFLIQCLVGLVFLMLLCCREANGSVAL